MHILNNKGDYFIFKPDTPYKYVKQLVNFNVEMEGDHVALEFRWSTDNKSYSAWIELSRDMLRSVVLNPSDDLYIEFRATLTQDGTAKIGDILIDTELTPYDKYDGYMPPAMNCAESGNLLALTRIDDLCFNPYDVNPAACLYNELSYMVNSLFGHETEYFRSVPNKEAQDIVLNEYTLYDVLPPVCLKVLVENNEFPDAELAFNPFGIDFEQPFEVHVDMRYFEEIMGPGTGPQKGDIIHFPINGRVYEVLSSYLFKAFMEQDSYWKVSLVKYQQKSKRYEPEEVRTRIDSLTTDTSKLFEEELREQEEKLTKPQQYNKFIGNSKYDPSRESLHKSLITLDTKLVNYSTVIAEYRYKLNNLVSYDTNNKQAIAVQYREPAEFDIDTDLAYSAWFTEARPAFFTPTDSVINTALDANSGLLLFEISSARNYNIGDIIKLTRSGGITLYGTIVNSISNSSWEIKINKDVLSYLDEYNPTWSMLSSYKATRIIPSNFIYAYDDTEKTGIKIELMASRYFVVTLNKEEFVYPLNVDIKEGDWYGLFINISNKFRQVSVNLWERKWKEGDPSSPQTTSLFNIYNKTVNSVEPEDRSISDKYSLLASNIEITNIRLYKNTAEIEKQALILNQNIVKDAHNALIIDNAITTNKLPFIGQSK